MPINHLSTADRADRTRTTLAASLRRRGGAATASSLLLARRRPGCGRVRWCARVPTAPGRRWLRRCVVAVALPQLPPGSLPDAALGAVGLGGVREWVMCMGGVVRGVSCGGQKKCAGTPWWGARREPGSALECWGTFAAPSRWGEVMHGACQDGNSGWGGAEGAGRGGEWLSVTPEVAKR